MDNYGLNNFAFKHFFFGEVIKKFCVKSFQGKFQSLVQEKKSRKKSLQEKVNGRLRAISEIVFSTNLWLEAEFQPTENLFIILDPSRREWKDHVNPSKAIFASKAAQIHNSLVH